MSAENSYKDFEKDALFAIMSETEKLANVGGWMWDVAQDVWTFSDNWLRIHGCYRRHLSTSELLLIAHPHDIADVQEAFYSAINKGINYEIEHRIIRQDTGEERHIRACGRSQMDADGKVVNLYGSAQDITERKIANQRLYSSNQRYKHLFNYSPTPIWEEDFADIYQFFEELKGQGITDFRQFFDENPHSVLECAQKVKILDVNEAAVQLFDAKEKEHLIGSFENIFTEKSINLFKEGLIALANGDTTLEFEGEVKTLSGERKFIVLKLSVDKKAGGQATALLTTIDITTRKRYESELRIKDAAIENSLNGFNIVNAEGKLIYVNKSIVKMYGYDNADQLMGVSPAGLCEDPSLPEKIIKILKEKGECIFEHKAKRKDGSLFDVLMYARLAHDENGDEIYPTTSIDITIQKKTEEALVESNEMFKRTEAIANVGSWEWDIQSDHVQWSDELFRIFGRDPSLGAPSYADHPGIYVAEDMQRLEDAVKMCVTYAKPFELELRAIRSDGEIRYCIGRGQAQTDKNGKIYRLVGSMQDITERKQVEEMLASVERRNRSLLDHSPVCHKIVDLNLNLQYMNASGYKILKVDEKDNLYGKPYPFDFFPESSRKTLTEKLHEVKKSGQIIAFESMACDSEGNDLWLYHSIIPVHDHDGGIEYITVASADITEQKHLQERMRQSEKMESVGRLAGGVAHDFNNMLSVIIGHAEMVMEDLEQDSSLYNRLKEIRNAGERSADLSRQLLAFARKQVISPKTLNLNKTVEGTLKILRRLIGEDIDLAFKPSEEVWPVKIDPVQIDQVLTNLCVNSRDAIKDVGKIFIEIDTIILDEFYCSYHPGFIPGEYVLLAVSDNGSGMDSETLSNIFEPFFTTKDSGQGTGLGLSTVYGVVKQNRGFVNVYSEQDQGTTFKIYLPRYRGKGESHSNKLENVQKVKGHETILLVEDEPAILKMTTIMLESLGYQVLAANSPGKAIRIAQEYNGAIHLLITDVIMPEMNGRNLAKNILSMYPDLRRLFMSGYSEDVIAHHGVLDEGVNFIQKPFSRDQLGIKIREALDRVDS